MCVLGAQSGSVYNAENYSLQCYKLFTVGHNHKGGKNKEPTEEIILNLEN